MTIYRFVKYNNDSRENEVESYHPTKESAVAKALKVARTSSLDWRSNCPRPNEWFADTTEVSTFEGRTLEDYITYCIFQITLEE